MGSEMCIRDSIQVALDRRLAKRNGTKTNNYRSLHNTFQRLARRDKNAYYKSLAEEVERHRHSGNNKELYRIVRNIAGPISGGHSIGAGVRDNQRMFVKDANGILARWAEYSEELYRKEDGMPPPNVYSWDEAEPDLLKSEVRKALEEVASGKAPGHDNVTTEMWKFLAEDGLDTLHQLCQAVWKTTIWPSDWKKSIFIPLFKKGDRQDCANYRTIALISHTSKVLLKVIQNGL